MDLARINTSPTEGQKIAGNYRKGHARVHGLDITIENPAGSYRRGVGANGKPWRSRLPNHYGYIRGTAGSDGDHVDVYLGGHLKAPKVFVIDQGDLRTGDHDEHKCFIGFASAKQARSAYVRAFSDGKGERRIRRMVEMDVPEFKAWLKDGGGREPLKRAAGGAVGAYAEGGAPAFDQTAPLEVPPFDQTQPVEDAGKLDAAWRGARAGATFNMGDEITGFRDNAPKLPGTDVNVPEFIGPIPARTLAGAARTGYGYMTGDKEAVAGYEKSRDEARKADKAAEENHPYIFGAGEVAGSIPAMAALPQAGFAARVPQAASKVAKFAGRALDSMVTGAQYGGLSGAGEGEGLGERAMKGASGIVSGIVGGGIGHGIAEGAGAVGKKFIGPVVNTVRGWMNPEGEAARRLASALKIDNELIMAGKANGMTPQQWVAARQAGEPVTLADLGAANTQSLLRSAANTSPEGRALLEKVIEDRFLSQSERVAQTVRRAIPGSGGNARKTGDQLVAEYDAARVPLYKKAYEEGDQQIFTPVIDRLTGSPTFGKAMVSAINSGKDRAITQGYGAFQPPVSVGPSGNFIFNRSGPNGGPVYPNLQYWDAVKRELDDMAEAAKRSGSTQASVIADMAKTLRGELDQFSSSYAKARSVAADFFGEKNALEAGRKLAGKKVDPEEVKAILRKMKPDERDLFKEGYASDLAERVIGNLKDTVNITKGQGMFQSPNERKMAAAIFGPGGMAMLQARMHMERIMDGARQAMGNSTTARQLIEAGLAGGALSGYASNWDPGSMLAGATGLAGARWGKGAHAGLSQVADSAKHMIGKVDAKTAKRVAELLTSDDPRLLREGYRMAAKSQQIMQGLKNLANRLALAGQTPAREPATQGLRMLQGPVSAGAEEQQQRP